MKVQLLMLVGLAAAAQAARAAPQEPLEATYRFVQNCGDVPLSLCVKRRLLAAVDDAQRTGDIPLADGVTLLHNPRAYSQFKTFFF